MCVNSFDWDSTCGGVLEDCGHHLQTLTDILTVHIVMGVIMKEGQQQSLTIHIVLL